MTAVKASNMGQYNVKLLTVKDVMELHELLVKAREMFFPEMEPINPAGPKDPGLLESTVRRQETWLEYSNVPCNKASFFTCAALVHGINSNHVFHNGNKRTSLLCMLKHLSFFDRNTNSSG